MSRREQSELAAKDAQIASLKGELARARCDVGHFKARLAIMCERQWSGDHRGLDALQATDGRPAPEWPGCID